jgi:hypothetical protein
MLDDGCWDTQKLGQPLELMPRHSDQYQPRAVLQPWRYHSPDETQSSVEVLSMEASLQSLYVGRTYFRWSTNNKSSDRQEDWNDHLPTDRIHRQRPPTPLRIYRDRRQTILPALITKYHQGHAHADLVAYVWSELLEFRSLIDSIDLEVGQWDCSNQTAAGISHLVEAQPGSPRLKQWRLQVQLKDNNNNKNGWFIVLIYIYIYIIYIYIYIY